MKLLCRADMSQPEITVSCTSVKADEAGEASRLAVLYWRGAVSCPGQVAGDGGGGGCAGWCDGAGWAAACPPPDRSVRCPAWRASTLT